MFVSRRPRAILRAPLIAAALASIVLLAPSAASAKTKVGAVYTETNDLTANQVIAFDRYSDGTLAETQRIATGGFGSLNPVNCDLGPAPPACPLIDSSGAVETSAAGGLVFAANAGSDTISSFRVNVSGLTLVDQVDSDGALPQSLTVHGNTLYVLNQNSGNIAGFEFTTKGRLTEIPGSNQPLATPGPTGLAAQVGFDHSGATLTVTERGTDLIDTFVVRHSVAGPAIAHPTGVAGVQPFGFAYDSIGHLVLSAVVSLTDGLAISYQETLGGGLSRISTLSTGGGAACWVAITADNRFAYITNTATQSVSRFALSPDGSLRLLGVTPLVDPVPVPANLPTDEVISRDGRFLYVLVPGVLGGDVGRIDAFRIGVTGGLTFIASTPATLPAGISGIAGS
jgi:6-phosphogluconolactonase (cycloisomerase 2 family)